MAPGVDRRHKQTASRTSPARYTRINRRNIILDPAADSDYRRPPIVGSARTGAAPRPPEPDYQTLAAFLRRYPQTACPPGLNRRQRARLQSERGRQLRALSRRRGYPVQRVAALRWGWVNAYATAILHEFFHLPG